MKNARSLAKKLLEENSTDIEALKRSYGILRDCKDIKESLRRTYDLLIGCEDAEAVVLKERLMEKLKKIEI